MAIVHFITQGCSANIADSEIMMGLLERAGHEITDAKEHAAVVVINTCTVKGPTESAFLRILKEMRSLKKRIVIAGCIPQSEKDLEPFSDCSLLGPSQIDSIVEIVEETLKGRSVVNLVRDAGKKLLLPKRRVNPLIEITQISTGCVDSCSFCKTKFARGHVQSFRIHDIREQIKQSVLQGVKQVWLTSQDNGAYGKDIGTNLMELLKDIARIPGDFKVRIGMANPQHILGIIDELIWLLRDHPRFFQFLHIPVQSGSNAVLTHMRRDYEVEDYMFIYKRLKEELPMLCIANDIICGYPTESSKDFAQTTTLLTQYPPDVLNISRFWPRPETTAAGLKLLAGSVVKERSRKVTRLFNNQVKKLNERWISWEGETFVDEVGKEGSFIARNYAYKPIVITSNLDLFGHNLLVRVEGSGLHDLRGALLSDLG